MRKAGKGAYRNTRTQRTTALHGTMPRASLRPLCYRTLISNSNFEAGMKDELLYKTRNVTPAIDHLEDMLPL